MSFRCTKFRDLQQSFDIYSETFKTTTLEKILIVAIIVIFSLMTIVPCAIGIFQIKENEDLLKGIYRYYNPKEESIEMIAKN